MPLLSGGRERAQGRPLEGQSASLYGHIMGSHQQSSDRTTYNSAKGPLTQKHDLGKNKSQQFSTSCKSRRRRVNNSKSTTEKINMILFGWKKFHLHNHRKYALAVDFLSQFPCLPASCCFQEGTESLVSGRCRMQHGTQAHTLVGSRSDGAEAGSLV